MRKKKIASRFLWYDDRLKYQTLFKNNNTICSEIHSIYYDNDTLTGYVLKNKIVLLCSNWFRLYNFNVKFNYWNVKQLMASTFNETSVCSQLTTVQIKNKSNKSKYQELNSEWLQPGTVIWEMHIFAYFHSKRICYIKSNYRRLKKEI